jgi:hypothetical protein
VQSFEELKILLEEAIEERIASDKMMKKKNLKSLQTLSNRQCFRIIIAYSEKGDAYKEEAQSTLTVG